MQTSNFPPKYVDTLATSNVYEKQMRHIKSTFFIEGMQFDTKYLSSYPVAIKPCQVAKVPEIFPKNVNHIDYIHPNPAGKHTMVKVGGSIDYLTMGCKVKFR